MQSDEETQGGLTSIHLSVNLFSLCSLTFSLFFITLDPRLSFPDSVGEIFPSPATIQKDYKGINGFRDGEATMIDSLRVLIRGDNNR